jgi:hypothetical protein
MHFTLTESELITLVSDKYLLFGYLRAKSWLQLSANPSDSLHLDLPSSGKESELLSHSPPLSYFCCEMFKFKFPHNLYITHDFNPKEFRD